MDKKLIGGIGLIVIGVIATLIQIYYVREYGRYWLIGGVSTAFVVLGIASFFVDLKGFEDEEEGAGSTKSFGDLPMSLKIVMGLAIVAGIAHAAAFETGMVMG